MVIPFRRLLTARWGARRNRERASFHSDAFVHRLARMTALVAIAAPYYRTEVGIG
jgi:hypothetical protein